jgi:chromosome segregation ATPase
MTSDNTDLDYRTGDGFRDLRVTVRNVGGISDGVVTIPRGVTLLSGENASNKSSFLRGLSAVLGAPAPTLKSDAEEGFVRLETDEGDYYVELASQNGRTVVSAADRFSDETRLCELFVSLDETNPIRQAVVGGDDLYELLMDPLDVEEIEAEIEELQSRRANVDDRLGEISRMEDRLPTLRTRADNLGEQITDIETSLAQKREAIDDRE